MILSSFHDNFILIIMSQDTYNAVKTAFSMFGTFMKDTAEIIGWEKVLELREKKGYQNGENGLLKI